MKFCTVVNCIDGRVQIPVTKFLQNRFNVDYVDSVTEPGPPLVISENKSEVKSILNRIDVSVKNHNSRGIAIAGHFDCAGNPTDEKTQIEQIKKSVEFLKTHFSNLEIIGLWVDEKQKVTEVK
ncbi:MAG: carbonic anhydrase [Rhodothermaceae bacterium]